MNEDQTYAQLMLKRFARGETTSPRDVLAHLHTFTGDPVCSEDAVLDRAQMDLCAINSTTSLWSRVVSQTKMVLGLIAGRDPLEGDERSDALLELALALRVLQARMDASACRRPLQCAAELRSSLRDGFGCSSFDADAMLGDEHLEYALAVSPDDRRAAIMAYASMTNNGSRGHQHGDHCDRAAAILRVVAFESEPDASRAALA